MQMHRKSLTLEYLSHPKVHFTMKVQSISTHRDIQVGVWLSVCKNKNKITYCVLTRMGTLYDIQNKNRL